MAPTSVSMNWQYQIVVPRDGGFDHGEMTDYCTNNRLSLRVFGADVQIDGTWYSVFCFDEPDDAETFRVRFNGRRRKWSVQK